jgi:hypothetical protein
MRWSLPSNVVIRDANATRGWLVVGGAGTQQNTVISNKQQQQKYPHTRPGDDDYIYIPSIYISATTARLAAAARFHAPASLPPSRVCAAAAARLLCSRWPLILVGRGPPTTTNRQRPRFPCLLSHHSRRSSPRNLKEICSIDRSMAGSIDRDRGGGGEAEKDQTRGGEHTHTRAFIGETDKRGTIHHPA